MLKHFFHIDNLIGTALVFIILIYFGVYFNLDFLDPIQNLVQDFYLTDFVFSKMRDNEKVQFDTNIVIVNVGTLNRSGIAEEINIINKNNPKVLGIDLFFRNPQSPERDSALSKALSKVNNLVLVSKVDYDEGKDVYDSIETSNPLFNRYASNGYANVISDTGKDANFFRTVRDFYPKVQVGDTNLIAFALKITQFYNPSALNRFLARNNETEIINFQRNTNKYRTIDIKELFEKQDSLQFIKDKIVLMGILGPDTSTLVDEDVFFTPMNKEFIGKSLPDMYGVTVHANIISMILEAKFINSLPDWISIAFLFILVYSNMSIFKYLKKYIEEWYEVISNVLIIIELLVIFVSVLYIHYWFNFEIIIQAGFFALIMSTPIFELYQSSFKPMTFKTVGWISRHIRGKK